MTRAPFLGDVMDLERVRQQLPIGELGEPFYYFTSIGSTNDRAKELARQGAPAGTLLLADEQKSGRGRLQRQWITPPGSALALSLILRPRLTKWDQLACFNGLAAVTVAEALEKHGGQPQIKWPNDVLLASKKVAGILVEAGWREQQLEFVVIGVGVNVTEKSVPEEKGLAFPATSVHAELGPEVSRQELFIDILEAMQNRLLQLDLKSLIRDWNQRLAFRGEMVALGSSQGEVLGELLGVENDGRIKLRLPSGQLRILGDDFGHLRPFDRDHG